MTLLVESVRTELAARAGESCVVTDAAACAALAVDGIAPKYVVYPTAAAQVAAVLRCAAEHDLAVIPTGKGTKLATGNPPRRYDLALSLRELRRVRHYEPADLTISVEAGMQFGDFQSLVGCQGLWLPLDPRGGAGSSLGGIVASGAAGPLRQGFGGPRDMVLGLKMATTDGKIVKTGGRVVKNVAGYDLGKLLIGSYGTLGVIVEASLKLYPKPQERATFTLRAATLAVARSLRRAILGSPFDPMRLVLLDSAGMAWATGIDQGLERSEAVVWVEVGGSHRVIERCERELGKIGRDAGAPLARLDANMADAVWGRISNLAGWLWEEYRDAIVLKAVLPIAAGEEFLSAAQQAAVTEHVPAAVYAQVGVGIVHVCLRPGKGSMEIPRLIARTREAALALGGRLVVEHSPVAFKSEVEAWGVPGDDFEFMRRMKSAWDPKGILAPGRFVGRL